jgi:hypothetical protein
MPERGTGMSTKASTPAYEAPKLVVLGTIAELTLTKEKGTADGKNS